MAATSRSPALTNRRAFLAAAAVGLAPRWLSAQSPGSRHLEITDIRRTTVKVPFRETPARNMDREIPHWRYSEVFASLSSSAACGVGAREVDNTGDTTDWPIVRHIRFISNL